MNYIVTYLPPNCLNCTKKLIYLVVIQKFIGFSLCSSSSVELFFSNLTFQLHQWSLLTLTDHITLDIPTPNTLTTTLSTTLPTTLSTTDLTITAHCVGQEMWLPYLWLDQIVARKLIHKCTFNFLVHCGSQKYYKYVYKLYSTMLR